MPNTASAFDLGASCRRAFRYLFKASLLTALLFAFGKLAPHLPAIAIPVAMLLYALPATLGTMYGVVAERHCRRYRYADGGKLAGYNRSWSALLPATFALHMASAFLFLLEAPGWSDGQWLLVWAAVPAYYVALLVVRRVSRREYAPVLSESRAIFWSSLLTGAALCIAYALATTGLSPSDAAGFQEDIQGRRMLFASSPCALMCEADKVVTYSNFLTGYGLGRIVGASFAAALVVKVLLGASVFFGFASQLGSCSLGWKDVKRVFQLLPGSSEEDGGRLLKRYLASIAALWLAFFLAFMTLDAQAEEARSTNEYTAVDQLLSDATTLIVLIADTGPDELADLVDKAETEAELNDRYREGLKDVTEQYGERLRSEIDAYYDACSDNVASYIAWRESPSGMLAMMFGPVREKATKDAFLRKVVEPVGRSDLDKAWSDYSSALHDLHTGYWSAWQELHPDSPPQSPYAEAEPTPLDLWPSWDEGEGALFLENVPASPEAKTGMLALIEERRAMALLEAEEIKMRYAVE